MNRWKLLAEQGSPSLEFNPSPPPWVFSSLDLVTFGQYCKRCFVTLGFWGVHGQKTGDVWVYLLSGQYVFVRAG